MHRRSLLAFSCVLGLASALGCGGDSGSSDPGTDPSVGPLAGNPDGHCTVPTEAKAADTSSPTHVVGDGTPASCTSAAVVQAVAQGGIITFDCGPDPVKITLTETAKIFNDAPSPIVIDGGGKVTLSGAGARRILYMNTCDMAQHWTTSHCDNQATPVLVVQNLTFVDGSATGDTGLTGGGGAIFVRGGRFKLVNTRFFNNQTDALGSDVGGGAIRVFDQYDDQPVYVVNSTFGGTGLGNFGANGGALSSIGVSWQILNSWFQENQAIGHGANDGLGGNGGAIYNDGNTFTTTVCGTRMLDNTANEGGGAIFYVSNDRSGHLNVLDSVLTHNPSLKFETNGYPGIFVLASGNPNTSGSTLTP
ncbi:MAG: hypothetical protein U0230_15470 [Polyangiales bacterium]